MRCWRDGGVAHRLVRVGKPHSFRASRLSASCCGSCGDWSSPAQSSVNEWGRVLVQLRSGAWGVVSVAETGRVWPHRLASCAGVAWSLVPPSYTLEALPRPPRYLCRSCQHPRVIIGIRFHRYAETCSYYEEIREGYGWEVSLRSAMRCRWSRTKLGRRTEEHVESVRWGGLPWAGTICGRKSVEN